MAKRGAAVLQLLRAKADPDAGSRPPPDPREEWVGLALMILYRRCYTDRFLLVFCFRNRNRAFNTEMDWNEYGHDIGGEQ